MNLADNATKAKCTDSLLNYETVKYYGTEDFEVENYKKAVLHFQVGKYLVVLKKFSLRIIKFINFFFFLEGRMEVSCYVEHT